ncbi:MAG: phosphoenolpyruvate--protein phosphotransferase [Clostridia bacterium]|nr:phosphoenolpyruvate--protein phosphotransferase [Clostridia bacterium]
MITLNGKGVYGGIAIGQVSFFRRQDVSVRRHTVADAEGEIRRYEEARRQAMEELRELHEKALRDIGESGAQIFEIHRMMLEDDDYNDSVTNTVRTEKVNAEYAVSTAADNFSMVFSSMDDPYMQARAADIRDISSRLLGALAGKDTRVSLSQSDTRIVCAIDLAPSETMQLDRNKVCAFITAEGSVNSHTAILARTMGIPAVVDVGEELMRAADGTEAIVDGFTGHVYLDPDSATMRRMKDRLEEDQKAKALLQKYKGMENITLDGTRIDIFANIQGLREVGAALINDAGGIGLFRSEFLYLDRADFPDEEEQFQVYKTVLQSMGGKKVVIRTMDIGADKQVGYFGLEKEDNPAMGMRAIRICLTRPEIFRPQLRALLRASVFGKLAVMFPMITSVREITEVNRTVDAVRAELEREGIPYSRDIEFGIMIETPAAALISDRLAPLVDFFSVGTNDLTQYTLALDRQNRSIETFFDPHHEAILRLIGMATENAHRYGKWIGICGELGADPDLTETFLRMGIDELSVSPAYILRLRDKIRNTDLRKTSSQQATAKKSLPSKKGTK